MDEIEKRWKFRDIAIALGIMCVILVLSLAGVLVYYISVVNAKDSTLQTDSTQINSLSSQVSDLNFLINLYDMEVVFNQTISVQAGQSMFIEIYENYSGYIGVMMEGYNLTSTWVSTGWWHGVPGGGTSGSDVVEYSETKNFTGASIGPFGSPIIDTEYFPIIQNYGYDGVTIGNNGNQTIAESVIITYYY